MRGSVDAGYDVEKIFLPAFSHQEVPIYLYLP
jgi:hypothetical protein